MGVVVGRELGCGWWGRRRRYAAVSTDVAQVLLAEEVRFELTVGLHPRWFSRPVH